MDFNKNYYAILGVDSGSESSDIKKAYYKLSFKYHPDVNKEIEDNIFAEIAEAYKVLSIDDSRSEYDKKSRFGKNYNELEEYFMVDLHFNYESEKNKYEKFKENEILHIKIDLNLEDFDGTLSYDRMVLCKDCKGSGKDLKSKIVIKDEFGNIKAIFDSEDGCDFCDGSGKDAWKNTCSFCFGQGKIGSKDCATCKGEKRILGKQKLTKIKIDDQKEETVIPHMGHFSKTEPGKCGNLILSYNR